MDELADRYLTREPRGAYICSICGKILRDKHNAKNHLECRHFPTVGGYSCTKCGKSLNTKNALNLHVKNCF